MQQGATARRHKASANADDIDELRQWDNALATARGSAFTLGSSKAKLACTSPR